MAAVVQFCQATKTTLSLPLLTFEVRTRQACVRLQELTARCVLARMRRQCFSLIAVTPCRPPLWYVAAGMWCGRGVRAARDRCVGVPCPSTSCGPSCITGLLLGIVGVTAASGTPHGEAALCEVLNS